MRRLLVSSLFIVLLIATASAQELDDREVKWNDLSPSQQIELFNKGSADLTAAQVNAIPVDKMTMDGASKYSNLLSSDQLTQAIQQNKLNPTTLSKLTSQNLVINNNINKLSDEQRSQLDSIAKNAALSELAKTIVQVGSSTGTHVEENKLTAVSSDGVSFSNLQTGSVENAVFSNSPSGVRFSSAARRTIDLLFRPTQPSQSITQFPPNTFTNGVRFSFAPSSTSSVVQEKREGSVLLKPNGNIIITDATISILENVSGLGEVRAVIQTGTIASSHQSASQKTTNNSKRTTVPESEESFAEISFSSRSVSCIDFVGGGKFSLFLPESRELSFNTWQKHRICVKREREVVNCGIGCVLVDLGERRVSIQSLADIEFGSSRLFVSRDSNADASLQFDARFGIVNNATVKVCTDCETWPSSGFALFVEDGEDFVWVNKTGIWSPAVIHQYSSLASTGMLQNDSFVITNVNGRTVIVFPSSDLAEMYSGLLKKTPLRWLSLPFLLVIPFFLRRKIKNKNVQINRIIQIKRNSRLEKSKRGQLTIFMLLGLVLLVIIIFVSFVSFSRSGVVQLQNVHETVQSCVRDAAKDAVLVFARQGTEVPLLHPGILNTAILKEIPSNDVLEKRLSFAAEKALSLCLPKVSSCGSPSFSSSINANDVLFHLNYCVREKSGDTTQTFSSWSVSVPVELNRMIGNLRAIKTAPIVNGMHLLSTNVKGEIVLFSYADGLLALQKDNDVILVAEVTKTRYSELSVG